MIGLFAAANQEGAADDDCEITASAFISHPHLKPLCHATQPARHNILM
jgi:hypothetical protein